MLRNRFTPGWLALILLALLVSGCSDDADSGADLNDVSDGDVDDTETPDEDPSAVLSQGCNPLAWESDCLLPYPTDFFREGDGGSFRVTLPEVALVQPRSATKPRINPFQDFPTDGFSQHQPIVAFFPEGIDDSDFPSFLDDLSGSVELSNRSLLMNAATGELVPHFIELDYQNADREDRVLIMRPLQALDFETRYIVAYQGLESPSGNSVSAPSGFAHLRDGTGSDDEYVNDAIAAIADDFEESVFKPLEGAGVDRDGLQLAWSFTTQSFDAVTHDMRRVRQLMIDYMADNSVEVSNIEIIEGEDLPTHMQNNVAMMITGDISVPLFLESTATDARLRRDGDGEVESVESAEYKFTAIIPDSVLALDDPSTARVIQFGHGFFGNQDESWDYPRNLAARMGAVVFATDWIGMSNMDGGQALSFIISDLQNVYRFVHRVHQGMANYIALSEAIQTTIHAHPDFQHEGQPLYDPDTLSFLGISQGHILGGTFLALSPHIDRAALHVGAMSFTTLMSRANPFMAFLTPIISSLSGPVEVQKLVTLSAHALDRIDPSTWVNHTLSNTLEGSPASRSVLMHAGFGDTSVPNMGTHMHARSLGLPQLAPAPRELPFMETQGGPLSSAFVELDTLIDPAPDMSSRLNTDTNDVHTKLRRQTVVMDQIDAFLRHDGQVIHQCGDEPCSVDLR